MRLMLQEINNKLENNIVAIPHAGKIGRSFIWQIGNLKQLIKILQSKQGTKCSYCQYSLLYHRGSGWGIRLRLIRSLILLGCGLL